MLSNPVFKFLSSLKLAVFSLLSLAGVLATATVLESEYGTRAAHVMVYGTGWFYTLLLLLGTNVLCAALSRFPWKRRHIGFVVTHTGILTILVGSFLTARYGIDGSLPVYEGSEDSEVILNSLKLSVMDEEERYAQNFPVPETALLAKGRLLDVSISPKDKLVIDEFVPRAVVEREVKPSPVAGVGQPAIKVEVFNGRFRVNQWLLVNQPEKATSQALGPATLTFQKLWSAAEEAKFLNATTEKKNAAAKSVGYLVVTLEGRDYRIDIDEARKAWQAIPGSPYKLKVDRYLPYAVVENNELANRNNEPVNPAVQLQLVNAGGIAEKHTVFSNFPDFTTRHKTNESQSAFPIHVGMISTTGDGPPNRTARAKGELRFAQSADDKTLLYQVRGSSGKINAKGKVKVGEEVATGWMDLRFQVTDWFPQALDREIPRYVERIQGGGESNFLTGVKVHVESERNPAGDTSWLIEGATKGFSVGDKKLMVRYGKERLTLPFRIFLQKFTIGNDPGTNKAATYQSDVVVRDTNNGGVEQKALISMNEPLKYGGYTFYQASYQLQETGPPISVFSVNYDPGRVLKYLGSLIMVLGIMLMFYFNPHYWDKILGKKEGQV